MRAYRAFCFRKEKQVQAPHTVAGAGIPRKTLRRVLATVTALIGAVTLTLAGPATPASAGQGATTLGFNYLSIRNCDNRMEDFKLALDNSVVHRWQLTPGGTWSAWYSLGGQILYYEINGFRNGDCKIEIFGVGTNLAMFTAWQIGANGAGGWSGWATLGGGFHGGPINSHPKDHLNIWGVCAYGLDDQLWCNYHTQPNGSPWTGWNKF